MTHPGVGPVTALAFTLTVDLPERFRRGKQVASYFGIDPQRTLQRWKATIGAYQPSKGVLICARVVGGSGAELRGAA